MVTNWRLTNENLCRLVPSTWPRTTNLLHISYFELSLPHTMPNIYMNIFMMRNWRVKLISTSFHLTYPDAPGENRRNQIEPNTFANAIRRPLYSVYIPMMYNSKYYDCLSHFTTSLSLHITCGWGQIWMISDSIRFSPGAPGCVFYTSLSRDWI